MATITAQEARKMWFNNEAKPKGEIEKAVNELMTFESALHDCKAYLQDPFNGENSKLALKIHSNEVWERETLEEILKRGFEIEATFKTKTKYVVPAVLPVRRYENQAVYALPENKRVVFDYGHVSIEINETYGLDLTCEDVVKKLGELIDSCELEYYLFLF